MAKVWTPVLRNIEKNADETGVRLSHQLIPMLNRVDEALGSGDMRKVGNAFQICTAIVTQMIPHIKSDELQNLLIERNQLLQSMAQKLEGGQGNINEVDTFLTESHNPLTSLLGGLLNVVTGLLDGILG